MDERDGKGQLQVCLVGREVHTYNVRMGWRLRHQISQIL